MGCRKASNSSPAVPWGPAVYKAGDPVLFADTSRFKPLIYNNLKGTIVDIQAHDDTIVSQGSSAAYTSSLDH